MANVRIQGLAQAWLRLDRDPETRAEVELLVEAQNYEELHAILASRLTFGTAGLRARMGAGFARLNSLTIIQTSQGLAEYLLHEGKASQGIVIGYDARHNSRKFAELAAAAFVAKQIPVFWYEDLVHTPMVPFGVKYLNAAAGIMITASHNPAHDNGYKVYGSNGCQINTPVDEAIALSILDCGDPITWDLTSQRSQRKPVLNSMRAKYFDILEKSIGKCSPDFPSFVYTPMHGVGLPYMEAVAMASDRMFVVEEQAKPDPDFPTVRFPNPEEDGALELAKSTADKANVTLIMANDPDADRFAAAEKVDDCWIQFTGDQIGVLLACYLLETGQVGKDDWVLTTAVSSQMLSVMAKDTFKVEETLTGFKWLGNKALEIESGGSSVALGYEEALGYMFPNVVHDKDGIAAALTFLHACALWGSPRTKLQQLYKKYGYFETMNTYWKSPDLTTTTSIFSRIRDLCQSPHVKVAMRKLLRWRDLGIGFDSGTKDNKPNLLFTSNSMMITCWLEGNHPDGNMNKGDDGVRMTIRTSGTEPKIKIYLECQASLQEAAKVGAGHVLQYVNQEWFRGFNVAIEEKYRGKIASHVNDKQSK